ncbi:hypothetical protein [Aquimarina mytili]|uniref:Uncharacterized protein n=1 Tax=Aquimarina mytili TaxID=874423 RepID=A0A936ZVZ6_9FLAO|nr:hypothetical protein [Aquimarina mytili]MBL0685312.1 hypothetical protein [Aquimarina mytili]
MSAKQHFINKFKEKTDDDLIFILNNATDYQEEAVNAARLILENRKSEGIHVKPEPFIKTLESKKRKPVNRLDTDPFLRTLSYRDFLTSFALGILLLSVHTLFRYYSGEDFIKNNSIFLWGFSFILLLSINHAFYRFEHKRSNNLIGRLIHDVIFIIMYFILWGIYTSIINLEITSTITTDDIPAIIFLSFLILPIEAIIGIVKRLFKLLKCEIL